MGWPGDSFEEFDHTSQAGIVTDLEGVCVKKTQPSVISARKASIAFSGVAGDKDFANVVFPADFVPTTVTIIRAYLWVYFRSMKDSSGAGNAINGASKAIRVKVSTGAWGTDDIIAMIMPDNGWDCDADARGSGGFMLGATDIKSIMSTPTLMNGKTINVRSEETNRSDAIVVDGASLTLYDVDSYIYVEYTL